MVVQKKYVSNPADLGVLSTWDAKTLDDVPAWAANKVPKFYQTRNLTPNVKGDPYRVLPGETELLKQQISPKSFEFTLPDR
jgi:hypothetical protein